MSRPSCVRNVSLNNSTHRPEIRPVARRLRILGVRVDDVTCDEVLALIEEYRQSGAPHQIMTPNPEFVMIARKNAEFRALLDRVDLAPADGFGLRWAAHMTGERIRELVPGSELVPILAELGAVRGERWFLLGAAEGVADAAGKELQRRFPGLHIAGTWSGSPAPEEDEAICRRIEAAMPVDVLLVAYGAPRQDLWISRNQPRLRIPVAMAVGGTFDFLAGRSRRPPRIAKRLNLIWLFRLINEPWRWRRQLALIHFVGLVLVEALQNRLHRAGTRSM
jgi:N-acetylglucosaminyldiphosphoundecaprenol N-acetyl-beta-D-mannosaminyltransferase